MSVTREARYTYDTPISVVSAEELRRHAATAQLPILLVVAVQITGDVSLIDRYIDRAGTVAHPWVTSTPDVPGDPQAKAEIIEILVDALTRTDQPEYLSDPDRETFARLVGVLAQEEVPVRFADMCRVQAGFAPNPRYVAPDLDPPRTLNVAVIGGGMTGIDAAVRAQERGFEWELFDMAGGAGGTWWTQRYPGAGVDTPCVFYSMSWELSPDWSKHFPTSDEYGAYLRRIVDDYDLSPHMHFNSEVVRLQWLEDQHVWELTVRSTVDGTSRTVRAAAVITGAGYLCRPRYPDVPGRETFTGTSVHTSRWPEQIELAAKRVGVVGVAAAGLQVINSIEGEVDHLTVFQRQPVWLMPNMMGDGVVDDSEKWLRGNLPFYLKWARVPALVRSSFSSQGNGFNHVDAQWVQDHPGSISEQNDIITDGLRGYINAVLGEGSELARKVTPDFPFGAKRPLRDPGDVSIGEGYYAAIQRPHVHLETSAITEVIPAGIRTHDGVVHELDVIVWATGQTWDMMSPYEIVGRSGQSLREAWDDYRTPGTYLGGMVPGFPNFFMNGGPHTGVAHGGGGQNFIAETVNHFIFETLQLLVESGASAVEVTPEAFEVHMAELNELMSTLIWAHDRKANTYYRNSAGSIIAPNPFPAGEYWDRSTHPDRAAMRLSGGGQHVEDTAAS